MAMTDRDRMIQAKAFIEAKQYTKARSILKTINHPAAAKWLEKVDEL